MSVSIWNQSHSPRVRRVVPSRSCGYVFKYWTGFWNVVKHSIEEVGPIAVNVRVLVW